MSQVQPKVSVGLPVYNAEQFLPDCLAALRGQTFTNFEIVISDNASQDGTQELCREAVREDERIRYVRQDCNRGAAWNFNEVFRLSRGEYFRWTGADDLCAENFLEQLVPLLDGDPELAWCHSLTRHIDAAGRTIPPAEDPAILPGREFHSLIDGECRWTRADRRPSHRFGGVILGTNWCSDSYGLIRSSVLRQTRLELPCYGSEKVLAGELALRGRFAELPEPLFFQRIHEGCSGNLDNSAQQQAFNADRMRRFGSTRGALLWGHLTAVQQAPMTMRERANCGLMLVRYLGQFQKWQRVFSSTLTGRGVADDTLRRMEQRRSEAANHWSWPAVRQSHSSTATPHEGPL